MRNKIISSIIILIIIIAIQNIVFASTESDFTKDDLMYIEVNGTGRIITKTTTADDIKEWYGGQAQVETESLWGGKAYSFYIGDKFDDYLFIETLEDGQIFSYGSTDSSYKTNTYSFDDDYPYSERNSLYGCLLSDSGIVKGGVYYNKSIYLNGVASKIIQAYKDAFLKDETTAMLNLNKHTVAMYNSIQRYYNNENGFITFNEEIFYMNQQMREFGTNLQGYAYHMGFGSTKYRALGTNTKCDLAYSTYYCLNPMKLAGMAKSNQSTDLKGNIYAIWDYNYDTKILAGVSFSDNAFERADTVPLTAGELKKLEEGRNEYNQAIESFNKSDEMYKVQPITNSATNITAGELTQDKKEGITHYMNAIRSAAGLGKVSLDEEGFDIAQHMSTLLSYRFTELGLGLAHYPPCPEGVSETFWKRAVGYENSWNSNLVYLSSTTTVSTIMNHINLLIEDENTSDPFSFGHRLRLLQPSYTRFGYGISPYMGVVELNGGSKYENIVSAWPAADGITFMETLSGKFKWSVKFLSKYEVQDSTTTKIECLNTGKVWNFNEEEKSSNRIYQNITSKEALTTLSNQVAIYDSTIEPQAGYVYVVTINGLKNTETGKIESYSYRTVFENASTDEKFGSKKITDISIEVPDTLKEISGRNIYETIVSNEEIKLTAKINEGAEDNLVKWTSSDPDIIEVTQNGTLRIKKTANQPVTITVCSDYNNDIKASVLILPTTVRVTLEEYDIELVESQEKTLKATLSNGENVSVIWSTSNSKIVDVDSNGKLIPKSGGLAKVTATTENYGSATATVYVCIPITLSDGSKAYVGDMDRNGFFNSTDASMILEFAMGAGDRDYYFIADVNGDGIVNSTDSAILLDWFKYQTFFPGRYYPITDITLNKKNIELNVGESLNLNATISPENTTDSPILTWTSDNENIVTVDKEGKVIAKAEGNTSIVVTTSNGKKATCEVKVSNNLIYTIFPISELTSKEIITVEPKNSINSTNFPILNNNYSVELYSSSNQLKKDNEKIGSKNVVQIKNTSGEIVKEFTAVVAGDVTGNGYARMYDAFLILKDSINGKQIDAIDVKIRDFNGDGKVRMYDAFQFLKKAIIGK